jgi:putative glycosyltransferase (TIGR04372 family)
MNQELLLRRQQLGLLPEKRVKYVGLAPTTVCNQQLLTMLKRELTIIQIPQPQAVRTITKIMADKSILGRWDLFVTLPYDVGYFPKFHQAKPALSFTEAEEQQGQELLKKMNIGNWFVCWHVRDSAYVSQLLKRGDSRYTYRNSRVENYLKAAEYIASQGGHAVRMGAQVEKKLSSNNHRIIDYATRHRTELGDIYLPAKCKFFVGNGSGVASIAEIFNVPVILTNVIPLNPLIPAAPIAHFPPGKNDLFLPKKIWSRRKNRFLPFKEMLEFERQRFSFETEDYEREQLLPVENTAEEIFAITREMHQRLDGTWITTEEDEQLQRTFKALFKQGEEDYQFSARIGAQFMRENKYLLEAEDTGDD